MYNFRSYNANPVFLLDPHFQGQTFGFYLICEYLVMMRQGKLLYQQIVLYRLSIGIFTLNLDPFSRSRSRTFWFLKWWQMEKILLLPFCRNSCMGFRLTCLHFSWLILKFKSSSLAPQPSHTTPPPYPRHTSRLPTIAATQHVTFTNYSDSYINDWLGRL